ncbi:glucosamine-6-phosphate deaminase [Paenibacillus radicis (ex Gao et al. 2016)]|jgi:glucosamine-6-phosphate deaminase|uniref:Glucosamine-6-phosphate deaminase n=1 Tax=Paenibacillus radicis (ex Gao et al. 2016) TaxID=1737354 RepID=A0A917M3L7_9BACL|nr:glucosamine-6-phosphate deaminase [Paenibacillus radicis (ex Gao et al. 2016)]GGG74609.1 glucosamine-6-phosphate deaminase 1 [Paenibacillus radicis (ex Gao et al. 2016)]
MDIKIFDSAQELDAFAADLIVSTVQNKPAPVLGLATGSTPLGIYAKIVEMHRRQNISFQHVTSYNLDEYVGLTPDNDQSYAYYMKSHLFAHIDIPSNQTFLPNGMAEDLEAECSRYDSMLQEQPVDLQLLGLGHNGHIGFNEPAEALTGGTHAVKLEQETREANARFFASMDEVPELAITMGVGSILKANHILLVVRGADKADIVKQALTGPITTDVPASLLQTHPRVTVLLDREAGRKLA